MPNGHSDHNPGISNRIAATAENDIWKPTSNSQHGRQHSIRNAATISASIVNTFSVRSPTTTNSEHISTARTTDDESPVRKANAHNSPTATSDRKGFNRLHRFHKGTKNTRINA